jgi:hypothetical protein
MARKAETAQPPHGAEMRSKMARTLAERMEVKGARIIRKAQTDHLLAAFKKLRHDIDREALVK